MLRRLSVNNSNQTGESVQCVSEVTKLSIKEVGNAVEFETHNRHGCHSWNQKVRKKL